jgi:hypothetical protein
MFDAYLDPTRFFDWINRVAEFHFKEFSFLRRHANAAEHAPGISFPTCQGDHSPHQPQCRTISPAPGYAFFIRIGKRKFPTNLSFFVNSSAAREN